MVYPQPSHNSPGSFAQLLPLRSRGRSRALSHDAVARRLHQRWIPRAHHKPCKRTSSSALGSEDQAAALRQEQEETVWVSEAKSHDEGASGGIFNLEFNQTGSVLAAACEQK